jgi:hypothetical protein
MTLYHVLRLTLNPDIDRAGLNAMTGGAYNPSLHSEAAEVLRRLGVAPAVPAKAP